MDSTSSVKVLFLDVDGVLNTSTSCLLKCGMYLSTCAQRDAWWELFHLVGHDDQVPYGPTYSVNSIDPMAVGLVNRLLDKEPTLRIVFSSSHRSFFAASTYEYPCEFASPIHLERLTTYLTSLGIKIQGRLIGITPRLHTRRGLEINTWLQAYDGPEITHHAAVDDEAAIYPYETTLIRTDAKFGLTADKYFELCNALGIHESPIIY
jgi:hypothetical protein